MYYQLVERFGLRSFDLPLSKPNLVHARTHNKSRHSLASASGNLVITVADNGIGIAAEHIDKIFDPFYTTKVVGRGAGLGLSMAREVVKKHGGSLEVQSVPGKGATFTLVLPMVREEA